MKSSASMYSSFVNAICVETRMQTTFQTTFQIKREEDAIMRMPRRGETNRQ